MSSTPPWAKIEAEGLLRILKGFTVWTEKPAFAWLALPDFLALGFAPQIHIVTKVRLGVVDARTDAVSAHFLPHPRHSARDARPDDTTPPMARTAPYKSIGCKSNVPVAESKSA